MISAEEVVQTLEDLAEQLSGHIEDDLPSRAARAAASLPEDCCRAAVTLWLQQHARRLWRVRTLERERAAQAVVEPLRPMAPAATESGHTGSFSPGSWNKRNRCKCDVCKAGRQESNQFEQDWAKRKADAMYKLLTDFERELKMEWTAELLASGFALPDGSTVTWGEATVEQHTSRVEMLQANAIANAEAAARHMQAINAIRESGVATLAEAVKIADG